MRLSIMASVVAVLLLPACGKDLVEFQKPGVSRAMMLRDDDKCWAEAHRIKGRITEAEKSKNVVEGVVTLGVVGIAGAAMVNAGADNPRGAYYVAERNACMRAKGYGVGFAGGE